MLSSFEKNDTQEATKAFTGQTGTFYIGFQLRLNGYAGSDFLQIYASKTGGTGNLNDAGASMGVINLNSFSRIASPGVDSNGPTVANDTTYQIVLKLSKDGISDTDDTSAGKYDLATLFINSATETGGTVKDRAAINSEFSIFGIRTANTSDTENISIDNLRIATTYAEAIPEPTAPLMLLLGAGGLLLRRSRR